MELSVKDVESIENIERLLKFINPHDELLLDSEEEKGAFLKLIEKKLIYKFREPNSFCGGKAGYKFTDTGIAAIHSLIAVMDLV